MLPVHYQAEILRLHFAEHLSYRRIAELLGVDRKTVAEVLRRRCVRTELQQRTPQPSMLAPYYPLIDKLLDDAPNRSAVNIHQRLREAGYLGGITILRNYLSSIRPTPTKEAFFQLDFAPGEAAQVDWGEFSDTFSDGTKVHAFVMVLCWSRMLYLEFTLRETLPALLRCYERALRFFGGLCHEYWHDNMPTVVIERLGRLVRFIPKFLAYAGFHGFKPVACNVGRGNEKGRVEDGVKLVRHQFWPGRHFRDLEDLNRQAVEWRDIFANRREHAATGKVPELLLSAERQALLPLRPEPYDTDDLVTCKVSPSYRVRFETNTYTVPWTLVGRSVTVRGGDDEIRVYYAQQLVARHRHCYQRRQDIENPAHREGLKERKPGAERRWDVDAVRSFGPHACRYLELVSAGRRSLRSELRELLCLATVYGIESLEETIGLLLDQGQVGANHLERMLRLRDAPKAPPPLELPDERLQFLPPAPNLQGYDALLLDPPQPQDDPEENHESNPQSTLPNAR